MGVFDWLTSFNAIKDPINKIIGVVDQAVVDKDLKNQLNADFHELQFRLKHAELELRAMAEASYVKELGITTIPWVDALHKMGRQISGYLHGFASFALLAYMAHKGQPITTETALALAAMGGPSAAYAIAKGKGMTVPGKTDK